MTTDFVMRPIYDTLLRGTTDTPIGVYHLHLVTAEQLCRLYYSPGSINAVKARLKTLVDEGYLQADAIPSKRLRSPYYYTLGAKRHEVSGGAQSRTTCRLARGQGKRERRAVR